jgi:hypothetical protein
LRGALTLLVGTLAVSVLILSTPLSANARDMHGRLGIGYNGEFGYPTVTNGIPAISAKYGLSRDFAIEAIVGFATTTPSQSAFGAKLFKNFFFENNLNFFFFGGAGLVTATASGFEFMAGLGVEFFIPGLESLGLSMETGVSGSSASGAFALRTLGASFLNAGMHFYF